MFEPKLLIPALCDEGVGFVLIGGVAAIARGSAQVTSDLDICYARQPENYRRLARALAPFDPVRRQPVTGQPLLLDAAEIERGSNFLLTTSAGNLDLLAEVSGIGKYEKVWQASEGMELYERNVFVLTLDGLIRAKRAAGRPKDLAMLPELEALRALQDRT